MQLRAKTEAGKRFVSLAEEHVPTLRERARESDESGSFATRNFDDLRDSGMLATFVPEELGGMGLDSVHDWAVGLERLGGGDASTAIALNMHLAVSRNLVQSWHGSRALGDVSAEERNASLLRAIAAGRLLICATATEPGTDFLRPATTATRTEDGWSIDGRKVFVTLSPIADLLVLNLRVPAVGDSSAGDSAPGDGAPGKGAGAGSSADRLGFAFVPVGTPGVEAQDDWDALGMRASGSQSIVFRDCRVPTEAVQIAGSWGRWSARLLMGRTLGNLTLVAVFLGIAERARELAIAGALKQTKPKIGGTLAQAAGVRHLLGEIDIELAAARACLASTSSQLDRLLDSLRGEAPELDVAHGCMRDYQCAKWTVNQNAIAIVSKAMDVCGGSAYMAGNELSRLYRDVRAGPFMQPFTPTEAREYVGRVAVGDYPEG